LNCSFTAPLFASKRKVENVAVTYRGKCCCPLQGKTCQVFKYHQDYWYWDIQNIIALLPLTFAALECNDKGEKKRMRLLEPFSPLLLK
jgi:hypothetical protein